jgi:ribosome-binding protein aMBF1 (putative translation factor)
MTKVEYLRCKTCATRWRKIGAHLRVEHAVIDICRDCLAVAKQCQAWSRKHYTLNAESNEPVKIHSAIIEEVTQ